MVYTYPLSFLLVYHTQNIELIFLGMVGGGTFDISILSLDAFGLFEVLATSGDTFLGGEDVDATIAQYIMQRFCDKHGVTSQELDMTAKHRIKDAAERAKIELDQVQ